MRDVNTMGLVLSGGGARGAYQSGVLKGVCELYPELRFPIITGFSAGAINAAFMAAQADDFLKASQNLVSVWEKLTPNQVYETSALGILLNGFRLIWDLSFGGLHRRASTQSLLNTEPLSELISRTTDFEAIRVHIEQGHLRALSVGATDYGSSESVSFFQDRGDGEIWNRKRRRSERVRFRAEHILASSALPLLFPAVQVGKGFYGDGSLRNVAPLSSAIHLGAEKLMIIGVRKQKESFDQTSAIRRPSLGRIFGVVLNAILLDTTDTDVERLARINETLSQVKTDQQDSLALKPINFIWMTPSQDLGVIAGDYSNRLPGIIRYLLRGLGSREELSELSSYLLFEEDFCKRLIELGYDDAQKRKDEIDQWMNS